MDRNTRIKYLEQIIEQGVNGYYEDGIHPKILDPIPLKRCNLGAAISAIKLLNEMLEDNQETTHITISVVRNPEPTELSEEIIKL